MKQLDVVVSPPAFVRYLYLTLTHMTFDLDPCDMNFFLVNFFLVNYYLVTFAIVTDRRTDRQTDRQTDGKRCIRAHRASAQVGSKTQAWIRINQLKDFP